MCAYLPIRIKKAGGALMPTYYRQLVILLISVVLFGCDSTDITINLTQSTLEVSESGLVADGTSSLLVTVTLRDGKGDIVSEAAAC